MRREHSPSPVARTSITENRCEETHRRDKPEEIPADTRCGRREARTETTQPIADKARLAARCRRPTARWKNGQHERHDAETYSQTKTEANRKNPRKKRKPICEYTMRCVRSGSLPGMPRARVSFICRSDRSGPDGEFMSCVLEQRHH